jgi:flagellar biosynthetic protein FliR
MLLTAGDILDMTFGFAMAKVFDPGTNIQAAFTANILNVLFILYFFATNGHLVLIQVAVSSYDLFNVGAEGFSLFSASEFAISLFGSVFELAMKLTFPFVAVEFILEFSLGILMKLIPQIHVFVIQLQLKIILAILLLFLFAGPISVFKLSLVTKSYFTVYPEEAQFSIVFMLSLEEFS